MKEEIKIDFDAFADEVKKKASEGGFSIKAYMPVVEGEDFFSGASFAPIVEIEGTSNAVMCALVVSALEETIKTLQTAVNNRKEKDNE